MKIVLVTYLCFLSGWSLSAQQIKLKLVCAGAHCEGTMSPKWYDAVNIALSNLSDTPLTGAQGLLQGKRFGKAPFAIAKNTLGTEDTLMIKLDNGWYPLTRVKFQAQHLLLVFNWEFRAAPTPVDIQVLKKAHELLSDSTAWNDQDDRNCSPDFNNQKWSLYCAVKQAYRDIAGDFNHRAAAMELLRTEISSRQPKRKYQHQIMQFNNESELSDILKLLVACQAIMEDQLK